MACKSRKQIQVVGHFPIESPMAVGYAHLSVNDRLENHRISLWIESVGNDTESNEQEQIIKRIENRIQEIDEILDEDSVEDRKQSALSRIQQNMTKWAKELELEHCDSPYRLDHNKVTVVVDNPDRPVPLKQLGSGSNWLGVHLIAYFALQYYFISANRPVPSFLFFNQSSQVYFPSELDEKNIPQKGKIARGHGVYYQKSNNLSA